MRKWLPGLVLYNRTVHTDHRGSFSETWKNKNFWDGMKGNYRQLNTAYSFKNVLRGMHRQDQSKLVMPIEGLIYDVALEPETGDWYGVRLDSTACLFIPPQYAHGYLVLSNTAIVQYIVDAPYNKSKEENFKWDEYEIDWPITDSVILSEKDRPGHDKRYATKWDKI